MKVNTGIKVLESFGVHNLVIFSVGMGKSCHQIRVMG